MALKCPKGARTFPSVSLVRSNSVESEEDLRRAQEELVKEGKVMGSIPYHENIANLQVQL